jgi:hypothetical protein
LVAGTAFLDQTFALHELCRAERATVREADGGNRAVAVEQVAVRLAET